MLLLLLLIIYQYKLLLIVFKILSLLGLKILVFTSYFAEDFIMICYRRQKIQKKWHWNLHNQRVTMSDKCRTHWRDAMGLNNWVTIRLSDDKRDKLNDLAGRMKIPPFSEFLGKRFPAFFTPALDDAKFVLNAFICTDQRPEIIAWCFFDAEPAEF